MGAAENKTLRTRCGTCDKELPTFVDPNVATRMTWTLVGVKNGRELTYAACRACYDKGWRPPGYK